MVLHREESAGETGLRKAFEDAEVVQSSCRPTTTARKSWENARLSALWVTFREEWSGKIFAHSRVRNQNSKRGRENSKFSFTFTFACKIGLSGQKGRGGACSSSCRPTTTARKSCRFECAYVREMRQGLQKSRSSDDARAIV